MKYNFVLFQGQGAASGDHIEPRPYPHTGTPRNYGFPGKGKIIHIFKIMYGIQPVDQKGRLQCHILISAGICIFHVSYPLFIRGRGKKLFSPESL